jgi:Tfp pilus assembly protein PilN
VSHLDLNLARKPFANSRPISRAAGVLWVLGGALLVFNAFLYWDYFTSSEDRRGELTATQATIADHEAAIAEMRQQLLGLQLPQQNAQVTFLNRKITERTFGWSRLFDDLEQVMPDNVRLLSLSPKTGEEGGRGRPTSELHQVRLQIDGMAKDGDAQLVFLDRLFKDPAFSTPDLISDAVDADGNWRFQLSVLYHPQARAKEPAESSTEEAESPEAAKPAADEPGEET